jgi:hypothetical protein
MTSACTHIEPFCEASKAFLEGKKNCGSMEKENIGNIEVMFDWEGLKLQRN